MESPSPYRSKNLKDISNDNIYLKGGQNLAEALNLGKGDPSGSQNTSASSSIAMRMKKNRDAALGGGNTPANNLLSSQPLHLDYGNQYH